VAPVLAAERTVNVAMSETIFPGLKGEKLQKTVRPFKSMVESATRMTGQIVESEEPLKLADKIKKNEIQMGVFLGHEYAWARQRNPDLEPIVIGVNREKTLKAFLVVRASSSYKKPGDLRGRTLTLAKETPEHCKLFLRRKCVPEGTAAKRFFKKIVRSTDVEEALDDVVDGKAQAALVDRLAWASYRQNKPGAAKRLRILLDSAPFPCAVLACQKGRFSAAEMKRVRDWLIDAKNKRRGKELLEQLRITSFEAMPDAYGRLFENILEAYPPLK
jgi:phosphonate transport system substrate-binding protein